MLLFLSGDNDAALALLERAVAAAPTEVRFLVALAEVQCHVQQTGAALSHLNRALVLEPRSVPVLNSLGTVYRACGRPADALRILRRALTIDRHDPTTLTLIGDACYDLGKTEQAVASFRLALEIDPDNATIYCSLGRLMLSMRKRDEARTFLEQAVARKPSLVRAHAYLATLDPAQPDDPRIAALEKLKDHQPQTAKDRAHVHFALGKLYDDCRRYELAFHNYDTANNIRADYAGKSFRIEDFERQVAMCEKLFTESFFARHRDCGLQSTVPVFVLGMPRSGTTLVESIVSSHPDAFGAGELIHMGELARGVLDYGDTGSWAPQLRALTADASRRTATTYRDALRSLAPEARRIVDKMPHNFLHLWLIALLLPQARVIHCRRDPLDTCLSCYFADFEHAHGYRNDLSTLGAYHRLYRRLMAHWQSVLPLEILDVDYEALVGDQEGVSRRIVEFIGLDWHDACLEFHRSRRSIKTVSNVQVGNRVYSTSVGRWRNYRQFLAPLQETLGISP